MPAMLPHRTRASAIVVWIAGCACTATGAACGPASGAEAAAGADRFVVTSPAFEPNGRLPAEFTCEGAGISPPVAWSGAPANTKWFALSLWHTASDREKSYWVVYDIPADVAQLEKDSRTVGRLGFSDKRRAEYEPMCPKGTKLNTYHITVFALAEKPKLPRDGVTRALLLDAIKDITLAAGTLNFQHQRSSKD